ncbi:DUF4193 family protein [Arthrobacter rhombi]|uniref:dUTPase n=1 Tax=Arthrobacter rhombi TaxID=71253 RepID=A0A1R4FTG0_9MICC|nr:MULTISPECIES: DUF4193 family protein [Micrococcaceae]PCC24368.1 DUF4193 domain-containing protein [Glutamicibacter sp. BW78]SJM59123.1 hypothetical protein FM101_05700 [Arthrobacter rhombi]
MAVEYDEVRPDVAERDEETLKQVKQIDAPNKKTAVEELDEEEPLDGDELPGAIIDEELVVQVRPQAQDEFTCGECFLVRYRSQLSRTKDGMMICKECDS